MPKSRNMGLYTWKDAPNGKIKKSDVSVAKNYLTEDEMKSMELIVSAYLDLAENPCPPSYPHDHGGLGQAAGHLFAGR